VLQLSVLNERLGEVSSTQAAPPSSALQHTLQRHQEILQDYSQEFRKTRANYRARREREDLLNTVRKDIEYVITGVYQEHFPSVWSCVVVCGWSQNVTISHV